MLEERYEGKLKIKNIFLIIALLFGVLWLFISPPFQAPDEQVHFYKAYAISEGQFLCSNEGASNAGSYLPNNIAEFVSSLDSGNIKKSPSTTIEKSLELYPSDVDTFVEHYNSCVYNMIPYIPQTMGILLGKIINAPFLIMFYLGRLSNFLFYITICYLSIKITPRLKSTFLLIALMPMAMHQAISLSPDALTNSLSFIFIAYILKLKYETEPITKRNYFFIASVAIIISFLKLTYFPLALAAFILPISKFKSKRDYLIMSSSIVILSSLSAIIWFAFTNYMNIQFPVNNATQLNTIIQDPWGYIKLLINNLLNYDSLYLQFVGVLGWLNITLPMIVYLLYFATLFIVIFIEGYVSRNSEDNRFLPAFISLLIVISSYILIETSLFLNWPQTNTGLIDGVQGRYFIPIVLMLFYSLYLSVPLFMRHYRVFLIIIIATSLVFSSYKMITHYYYFGPKYNLLEPNNNNYIKNGILNKGIYQSFIADKDDLSAVSIYISTFEKEITTPYLFVLYEKNDMKVISEVILNTNEIKDNSFLTIKFNLLEDSKGKEYVFSVYPLQSEVSTPITVQLSEPNIYKDGDLYIDQKLYEEDIVFRLVY